MVRTRARSGAHTEAHDVVVYATGTTVITGPDPDPHQPDGGLPVGDQFRRAATALHDGLDHARRFHARTGPRIGANPATVVTAREGTKSEIIRPVLLDPWRAWEVAGSGQLFAEPIPRLRIDAGRSPTQATYPMWTASLRTGKVTHRTAQLHVSASPSFNVTVLELIPATRRRLGNRSFLRVGLPVIEELARRLESARPRQVGGDTFWGTPSSAGTGRGGERWPHT
ncbi:MAG: hypothetical protein ACRDZZ_05740 [Ilumatobacteraceae bacterium]